MIKLLKEIAIDTTNTVPDGELPPLDAGHGACVACVCTSDEPMGDPARPRDWCARLELKYADGFEIWTETRMAPILFYGFVKAYTKDGRFARLGDHRLMATLAYRTAQLRPPKVGPLELWPEASVERIMDELSVPRKPVRDRDGIEEAWMDAWKKSGLMVKMTNGEWYVESLCLKSNDKYKVSRYVKGVEKYILGRTDYVELCTGEVKRTEDLTEGEMILLADQSESPINCGWVDEAEVRALYDAQQKAKAEGKPLPEYQE